MNAAIVIAAVAIGLIGAWLLLQARGGRWGEWSWRDGGRDGDV